MNKWNRPISHNKTQTVNKRLPEKNWGADDFSAEFYQIFKDNVLKDSKTRNRRNTAQFILCYHSYSEMKTT